MSKVKLDKDHRFRFHRVPAEQSSRVALPYTVLTDENMASTNTNSPAVHCVAMDKAFEQARYRDLPKNIARRM